MGTCLGVGDKRLSRDSQRAFGQGKARNWEVRVCSAVWS